MRAYGWNDDGTVNDTEAAVLRRVADHVADGGSLRPFIKKLTDEGITTANGKGWEPITIKRALTNPRIIGKKLKGDTLIAADIPAILDEDKYNAVVKIITDPDRQRFAAKETRSHLLSGGLVRCGKCGSRMFPAAGGKGRDIYACMSQSGCGGITIVAQYLEDDVTERVLARLTDPATRNALARSINDAAVANTDREIAALNTRLKDLGTDYARGLITRDTLHSATAEIKDRTAKVHRAKEDTDTLTDIPDIASGKVIEWWEDASTRRRRDTVAVLLDHVTVKPLPRERRGYAGLDTNRLEYFWRNA